MSTDLRMDIAEHHASMKPGTMTPGEMDCLRNVVRYLYGDEQKDYRQHFEEGREREDHIFKSVYVLAGVVNRQPETMAA